MNHGRPSATLSSQAFKASRVPTVRTRCEGSNLVVGFQARCCKESLGGTSTLATPVTCSEQASCLPQASKCLAEGKDPPCNLLAALPRPPWQFKSTALQHSSPCPSSQLRLFVFRQFQILQAYRYGTDFLKPIPINGLSSVFSRIGHEVLILGLSCWSWILRIKDLTTTNDGVHTRIPRTR